MYVNLGFAIPAALGGLALLHQTRPATGRRGSTSPARSTATTGLFATRLRLLERRDQRLGRADHDRQPRRRRRAARRLRRDRAPRRAARCCRCGSSSTAPAPAPTSPWPIGRRRDVRRLPLPHLLPAADARLLAGRDRARVPADGRRDRRRGRPDHREAAAAGRPAADRPGGDAAGDGRRCSTFTGVGVDSSLRLGDPPRPAAARPRHRAGHGAVDGERHRRRRATPTPASPRRWSTPASRSAARSGPRS